MLRYWGKISFSVYLLHSFVAYSDVVRKQKYYDKVFALFLLTMALSTASYYLIEYPCQQSHLASAAHSPNGKLARRLQACLRFVRQ